MRLVLPGLVLGLALYVYYLNVPIFGLSRTFGGMLIGHILVTMPFVIGTVHVGLVPRHEPVQRAKRQPLSAAARSVTPR